LNVEFLVEEKRREEKRRRRRSGILRKLESRRWK